MDPRRPDRVPRVAAAGATLARFLELRGRRVFEAEGVLWGHYRGPFHASLPPQQRLDPDPAALGRSMRKQRVAAVRYPTIVAPGWPSGLYACATRGYSLERVNPRYRGQVRKGLDTCEVRPVDPDELLVRGLELNLATMARQERFDPEFGVPSRWGRFVRAVRDTPGVSVLGAFVNHRLACYMVACRDGDWIHFLYKFSRTEDLVHRANQAIDFHALRVAGEDWSVRAASNGYTSTIDGGKGLHRYKVNMGYELLPHALGVRFHPMLHPIVASRAACAAAALVTRLRPGAMLAARVLESARLTGSGDSVLAPGSTGLGVLVPTPPP